MRPLVALRGIFGFLQTSKAGKEQQKPVSVHLKEIERFQKETRDAAAAARKAAQSSRDALQELQLEMFRSQDK